MEFALKIAVELYIYPLFLICLNFYVKKYSAAQGDFTTRKKMSIVWIYFIFFLNLIYGIISFVFRILRYTDSLQWEPFAITNMLSVNFLLPIKDYFLSITLITLVYQQCLAQISKQKNESVSMNKDGIFSGNYDPIR